MKNVVFTLIGAAVVAVLALLAFVYSGTYDVAATKENSAAKTWLMQTTLDRSVSSRAADIEVPDLDDPGRMLGGASHYDAMCADCHGAPGRRRAEFAPDLNPEPPHFGETPPEVDKPAARRIFWVTKHGIEMTGMPAWGPTHSDDDLWDMVAFMKKFPKMSATDYQGWVTKAKESGHHHGEDGGHGHGHGHDHDQHEHGPAAKETHHEHDETDGHAHDEHPADDHHHDDESQPHAHAHGDEG